MSAEDFYLPQDVDVLRMENDLLALENQILRRRHEDDVRAAVRALRNKHAADTRERRARYASVPHDEYARLRKAKSDLTWLVRRLGSSPAGPLFRRWPGWRTLQQRWDP